MPAIRAVNPGRVAEPLSAKNDVAAEERANTSEHRAEIRLGAFAGLIAPVAFIGLHNLQILLGPGYSQIGQPIGLLSTQPMGWIQNVTLVVCGVLYILFARGLSGALRPNLGPWLHMMAGLGVIVTGLFPWRLDNGAPAEPIGNTIGVFMTLLGAGAGLIALRGPMADDRRWRPLDLLAAGAGVLLLALFASYGGLAQAVEGPFHAQAGLFERAMVTLWFFCTFVIALRMLRIGNDPSDAQT